MVQTMGTPFSWPRRAAASWNTKVRLRRDGSIQPSVRKACVVLQRKEQIVELYDNLLAFDLSLGDACAQPALYAA